MFGHKRYKYAGEVEYIPVDGGKSVVKGIKQCVHCGGHWVAQAGSGNRRGWCFNCDGDICSDKCSVCNPYEKQMSAIREKILKEHE